MKTIRVFFLLTFVCFSFFVKAQLIPNAGFENWASYGSAPNAYEEPVGWHTVNAYSVAFGIPPSIMKDSSSRHSGNYSIELQTETYFSTVVPGIACTGNINVTGLNPVQYSISGGFPVTSLPTSVSGWFRDSLVGGADSFFIIVYYTKWNQAQHKKDTVAYGRKSSGAGIAAWTSFQIDLVNDSVPAVTPDSGMVLLLCNLPQHLYAGNTLWVDDLTQNFSMGISPATSSSFGSSVFPVPSSGDEMLEYTLQKEEVVSIRLTDMTGRTLKQFVSGEKMNAGKHERALVLPRSLARGEYLIVISAPDGNQSVKIERQ